MRVDDGEFQWLRLHLERWLREVLCATRGLHWWRFKLWRRDTVYRFRNRREIAAQKRKGEEVYATWVRAEEEKEVLAAGRPASSLDLPSIDVVPDVIEVVCLEGEYDLRASPKLAEKFWQLSKLANVVVDLRNVTRLDSSTLAVLLEAMQKTEAHGRRFALYGVADEVKPLFGIARLDHVFEVATSGDVSAYRQFAPPRSTGAAAVAIDEAAKELTRYLSKHPSLLYHQTPQNFERVVGEILLAMGYDVEHVGGRGDRGRDLLATKLLPMGFRMVMIVQCKRLNPRGTLPLDAIKSLLFTLDTPGRATCGFLATTARLGPEAIALQHGYNTRLTIADHDRLKEWLVHYGTWTTTGDSSIWVPV